jgi:hypothetical protein
MNLLRCWKAPITTAGALTAAADLFEALGSTNKPLIILGWNLYNTTDVKDAEEEILELACVRGVGTVTSGSGGSTSTVVATDEGTQSLTPPVVETLNTTRMAAGSGTLRTEEKLGWNVRIPWLFYFPEIARPFVRAGDRWTLALLSTPADSITIGGTLYLAEGG